MIVGFNSELNSFDSRNFLKCSNKTPELKPGNPFGGGEPKVVLTLSRRYSCRICLLM